MYLSHRDKDILKWVESNGSITINQCSKLFFRKNKERYYQSRKRLRKLSDNGFLKRYRKDMRSEAIYFLDKKLSVHNLKIFDVYAELINIGAEIKEFKREYRLPSLNKKYRSIDGYFEFIYDGYFYPLLLEVDYTHFTSKEKILDIYNSNYFQEKFKKLGEDIFPTVLIMRPYISQEKLNLNNIRIVYTDLKLINFKSIF